MEETEVTIYYCDECGTTVQHHHRYCAKCGACLGTQGVAIDIFNNIELRRVFIFYFLYLLVCLMVKHTSWFDNYDQLFFIELLLAAITLRFAWLNREQMKPVLKFTHGKWYTILGVAAFAAAASCVVSLSVRELNVTFFQSEVSYYQPYKPYLFPITIMVYSVAVMPALFEEMAFRGVMYNYCSAFLDERMVVTVTAFLFAIMHLNLISLVWLIPFGIFIGHLRRKYNTVWYGIIFHFVFNLTACIIDLYKEGELFIF